jgi:hypothetical protein
MNGAVSQGVRDETDLVVAWSSSGAFRILERRRGRNMVRVRQTRRRYQDDHVFRSLVDVLASHFRLNLKYTKREVLDAVAEAEAIVKEKLLQWGKRTWGSSRVRRLDRRLISGSLERDC